MTAIRVSREKGRETDQGDFEFKVTVPKESVAVFFSAFPGFEIDLILPQAMCVQPIESRPSGRDANIPKPKEHTLLKWAYSEEQAPTQSLSMQGWDAAQVGMTIAPNADVLELCRLPTFQEYALNQQNMSASEIENSDVFALEFAQRITAKAVTDITAADYMQTLYLPFMAWMRGRQ